MKVDGTCVVYVIPEGCTKPRTLKCLVTPSLEDEEILLGWSDMVAWKILKKDFHVLSDEDMEVDVKKISSNPNTGGPIGGMAADHSNCPSNGSIGKLGSSKEAISQASPHSIVSQGPLVYNMTIHILNILNQKALFNVRAESKTKKSILEWDQI